MRCGVKATVILGIGEYARGCDQRPQGLLQEPFAEAPWIAGFFLPVPVFSRGPMAAILPLFPRRF